MDADTKKREPGCVCHQEEGDSACHVHGDCSNCGEMTPFCCSVAMTDEIQSLRLDAAEQAAEVASLRDAIAAAEARAEKAEGEVRYLRARRKWEVATLSPSSPLSVSCQAAVVAGQEGDCASCRGWLAVSPAPQPPEGVAP